MNRTELIDKVADAAGLDKKSAEAAISAFVETCIGATRDGDKVTISGFGTFVPKHRAARTGINPQTRESIQIAASNAVGFTPAQAYKTALNPAPAKKATPAKKAAKKK